jgi:two-component system, NarL family, nitrate/nitrite response regulator NarL
VSAVASGTAAPMRVLVVDDEPDVRLLLRFQLAEAGFDVVGEAADGAEAIERCGELAPDAVVLDLLMPRVNGFEAIPLLRSTVPDVRIVAYTAVAGDFVRNEMARLRIPLVLKSGSVDPLANALRSGTA